MWGLQMSEVYTSVPVQLKADTPQPEVIEEFLKLNPEHFFTAKQIAYSCGFSTIGSCVEVRKAITTLIETKACSIISSSNGFTYTQDPQKIKAYSDSLMIRLRGLGKRIYAVNRIYEGLN
jgi:hypothetical protein